MLSQGRVSVNGKTCMIAAFGISRGDTIEIGARRATAQAAGGLRVLYEDGDLLIVQKPPGLLTVATPDERDRTAYAYLREYLREHNPRQKLYIVHRLDKLASGVLVFAKSERVKSLLQGVFSRHDIERKYWAIVEGNVLKDQGTVRSHLAEDRSMRMHSTGDAQKGKQAITHFRVLNRLRNLTVLEVTLETGRKPDPGASLRDGAPDRGGHCVWQHAESARAARLARVPSGIPASRSRHAAVFRDGATP